VFISQHYNGHELS